MSTKVTPEEFERFGYDTDKGCDLCGAKPAKLEPRFYYPSCIDHAHISPVERQTWLFDRGVK
jgi:hypothetical protein